VAFHFFQHQCVLSATRLFVGYFTTLFFNILIDFYVNK
jgi:hypothetical protein